MRSAQVGDNRVLHMCIPCLWLSCRLPRPCPPLPRCRLHILQRARHPSLAITRVKFRLSSLFHRVTFLVKLRMRPIIFCRCTRAICSSEAPLQSTRLSCRPSHTSLLTAVILPMVRCPRQTTLTNHIYRSIRASIQELLYLLILSTRILHPLICKASPCPSPGMMVCMANQPSCPSSRLKVPPHHGALCSTR